MTKDRDPATRLSRPLPPDRAGQGVLRKPRRHAGPTAETSKPPRPPMSPRSKNCSSNRECTKSPTWRGLRVRTAIASRKSAVPRKVAVFGSTGSWVVRIEATTSGPAIVIGRKGSIGEINWSNDPCFPIDTTYFVEKTKKPCDLRWLYFTLQKLDLTALTSPPQFRGRIAEDAYQ